MKQWQRYLAELFGTFVLVFVGCTAIVAADSASNALTQGPQTSYLLLVVPFGFGLALLAALYAFAEVSGGHFNPAVSLGMFLDRRLSLEDLLGYWIFQFAGGILASLLMLVPFNHDYVKLTATIPSSDGTAFFIETSMTAIFVLVILHSTKSDRHRGTALVAIPLTLLAIHFAAIPFSGASVNPARTLGPALVGPKWDSEWIYFAGPALGAIIAFLVYTIVIKGGTSLGDDLRTLRGDRQPPATGGAAPPAS